ncbi:diiron oxygenase [Chryseobacterium sp. WG14]|uniref:diiron oxygenase n=1 Tax=Chryseobacterium sp. WG14 TaxID=2926909 RepID=UPI00211DC32F|nr:diiron oxygenase [Chryseobacterium sp. WG14]MCQ9639003.1 diiron oxygenase [Chryseobacterium sp. WG14]
MNPLKKKTLSPKFSDLLEKLNKASEKKQMSLLLDHPWDEPTDQVWLKKRENISIYGTPYYDLASEEERRLLSVYETGAWWYTFIVFENLVSEYYMKIVNHGSLKRFPEVVQYIHHFCKEEIVHAMVFRKAMNYFNIAPFPVPLNLREIYSHNASMSEFPLKAIYLTILIEWLAENNAMEDCNSKEISKLSRAVAVEHHKEEARHIEWGKNMIREFIDVVPEFLNEAREITAPMLRSMLDMSISSIMVYARVGFKDKAFKNYKELIPTVLNAENRKKINSRIMAPMMRYFIEIGICTYENIEIWKANGFEKDVEDAIGFFKKKSADESDIDNVMDKNYD